MVLVVYAHTVQLLGAYGWNLGFFDTANVYLTAVRMPLFFLISGVFAHRAIQRSWSSLFASRLALLIYMYLLWMLIRAVWFSVVPWPLPDVAPWLALLIAPVWPSNGLWFLFALIVYLVLAKATQAVSPWITVPVFAVLAVLAAMDLVPTGGNWVWHSVMMYAFFFLLGVHATRLCRTLAERATLPLAVPAVIMIPAGMALFSVLPHALQGVGRIVLSTVCVAACIVVASVLSRFSHVARPFVYVGRRTLPIYVTHAMLLALFVPLLPVGGVPAALAIIVLCALGVAIPLGLNRWLGPLGGIYSLPHPATSALRGWAARRERPRQVEV